MRKTSTIAIKSTNAVKKLGAVALVILLTVSAVVLNTHADIAYAGQTQPTITRRADGPPAPERYRRPVTTMTRSEFIAAYGNVRFVDSTEGFRLVSEELWDVSRLLTPAEFFDRYHGMIYYVAQAMWRGAGGFLNDTVSALYEYVIVSTQDGQQVSAPASGSQSGSSSQPVHNQPGQTAGQAEQQPTTQQQTQPTTQQPTQQTQPQQQTRPNQQALPVLATVLIDGNSITFQAHNIGGNNFFRLRDLAYALSGTASQFNVGWDAAQDSITLTANRHYIVVGGEMAQGTMGNSHVNATPTASRIMLDGSHITPRGYLIGSNNYFMLRDLGELLGFGVDWNEAARLILISSGQASNNQTANNQNTPEADNNQTTSTTSSFSPVLFDGLTLLTSAELAELASTAPSHFDTRSATALPNRRLTNAELDAWIEEYRNLGGINAVELETIRLINEIRVEHGLNPLMISMELSMAARFHSQDMYDFDFLAHTSPRNGTSSARAIMFNHVNVTPGVYGARENAGGSRTGNSTAQARVDAWMNSAGHRAAILEPMFVSIGIGRVGGLTTAKFGS